MGAKEKQQMGSFQRADAKQVGELITTYSKQSVGGFTTIARTWTVTETSDGGSGGICCCAIIAVALGWVCYYNCFGGGCSTLSCWPF